MSEQTEPQTLRDIFGAEVGDKVCALPIRTREWYDLTYHKERPEAVIPMPGSFKYVPANCCIVGAFIRTAAGERGMGFASYPPPSVAIEEAEYVLGRKLSKVEKHIIRQNIREWDLKKSRREKQRRIDQVKRECAARNAEQGEKKA